MKPVSFMHGGINTGFIVIVFYWQWRWWRCWWRFLLGNVLIKQLGNWKYWNEKWSDKQMKQWETNKKCKAIHDLYVRPSYYIVTSIVPIAYMYKRWWISSNFFQHWVSYLHCAQSVLSHKYYTFDLNSAYFCFYLWEWA